MQRTFSPINKVLRTFGREDVQVVANNSITLVGACRRTISRNSKVQQRTASQIRSTGKLIRETYPGIYFYHAFETTTREGNNLSRQFF